MMPSKKEPLRIAIVGARSSKWTGEQELRVKSFIKSLLQSVKEEKKFTR